MRIDQLTPEMTFLIEHLDLPSATGIPDANWETFQFQELLYDGIFGITTKSRQVGWSWIIAAQSIARATINKVSDSIFVSINLEEAGEKIRYANQIIDSLDASVRPKKVIDNRLELELATGSRLVSHPCRPVRGKARAWVYLDEFAHYREDSKIYTSAVPVTSKGGALRIGSTPLGAGGKFWEIYSQSMQKYPGYRRLKIPWWSVRSFCKDVPKARLVAPLMTTAERIHTFGTERIVLIYENMVEDDFRQEYECEWVDEAVAFIDWKLIDENQVDDGLLYWKKKAIGKNIDEVLQVIDEIAVAVNRGLVEPVLIGGMDIGRHHDKTEIVIRGETTANTLPLRALLTLDKTEFDYQSAVIGKIVERLPMRFFLIDQNGIGMNLAENAARDFGAVIQPFMFTNQSKELMANEIKLRYQRHQLQNPIDRDLKYQTHSIKKKITAAKNAVFDCDATEKHHADIFWADAMAVWSASEKFEAAYGDTEVDVAPWDGFRG